MNPVLIYRSKCPESEGKVLLNIYSHLKVNSKTFFSQLVLFRPAENDLAEA